MVWGFQTVLSERQSERFVRIERHVPHIGPACDFILGLQRVKRLLLADLREERWYSRGWSHQKKYRGYYRVGEIIDENQKKHRAQNTALRNSSLDRKRI